MPRFGNRKWAIALALIACGIALCSYVLHVGNTDSWPETTCTVDSSRVMRENVADSFRNTTLYRGQYRLRYSVGGREYYVWANAGWSDANRQFVQDRVGALPDQCNFRVRYNPVNPAEAIADRR